MAAPTIPDIWVIFDATGAFVFMTFDARLANLDDVHCDTTGYAIEKNPECLAATGNRLPRSRSLTRDVGSGAVTFTVLDK